MSVDRPDSEQRYVAALGRLSQVLVDAPTLQTTLEELLQVTTRAAPEVTALSITAVSDTGELTSAASTDEQARAVDEHEFAIAEGPCIAALATGEEQLVRDAATDDRWPRFASSAVEHGFRSIAGLPLQAPDGTTIGALNAFGADPDGLTEEELRVLRRVCLPAAAVLANARAYRRTSSLSEDLAETLEHQAVVHRAVGVVLGRHGGTPDEALAQLRRIADREGTAVTEAAVRLTAGELDIDP